MLFLTELFNFIVVLALIVVAVVSVGNYLFDVFTDEETE